MSREARTEVGHDALMRRVIDLAALAAFGLYTLGALTWLLAGALPHVVASSPRLHDTLHEWSGGESFVTVRAYLEEEWVTDRTTRFEQRELAVPAGAEVVLRFVNQDFGGKHNVAILSPSGERVVGSDTLTGGIWTSVLAFTAPAPGRYTFHCEVVPAMRGTLVAVGPPALPGPIADAARRVAIAAHGAQTGPLTDVREVSGIMALVAYVTSATNIALGLLLIRMRPRLLTARLLAFGLVGTATVFNFPAHAAVDVAPGLLALIHDPMHIVSGVAFMAALLTFPDGRLALPRLEPLGILRFPVRAAYALGLLALGFLFVDTFHGEPSAYLLFFGVLIPVAGLTSQGSRLRSATNALERQQTRLLLLTFGLVLAITLPSIPLVAIGATLFSPVLTPYGAGIERSAFVVVPPLLTVIPVMLVLVLLRYRLWDLDRVLNRALVYGALTAALGLGFLLAVLIVAMSIGPLIGPLGGDLAIGLLTLGVAALFRPLRRRLQVMVDRRFYRAAYDAERALDQFAESIRREPDLAAIEREVIAIVRVTMQPDHAALRIGDAPAPAAPEVEVTVPLVAQGETQGLLALGRRRGGQRYTADDLRFLGRLAGHAAPALQVARLVRQREADSGERERVAQEVRLAQHIQQQFLPAAPPRLPGWTIDAHYRPTRTVGGDFYDFIELPGHTLGIVIGDVTGHGVAAAMLMSAARTLVRSMARTQAAPGDVLFRANAELLPDRPSDMAVTCLYGVLDLESGRLCFANAGHLPPHVGGVAGAGTLEASGLPLGLIDGERYEEHSVELAPGDELLLYSDGVTEARDAAGELFGLARLRETLAGAPAAAGTFADGSALLREAVAAFAGGRELGDDVTIVRIRRDAPVRLIDSFTVPSTLGREVDAADRVVARARAWGLGEERLDALRQAAAEATMNAMEHGNRLDPSLSVTITVGASAAELVLTVSDAGGARPMRTAPVPDIEEKIAGRQAERGWGTLLIARAADDVRVHADGGGRAIELVFRREAERDR